MKPINWLDLEKWFSSTSVGAAGENDLNKMRQMVFFNCQENEAGCRPDEGNHIFIRWKGWSAKKETEKVNFSTYNKKTVFD